MAREYIVGIDAGLLTTGVSIYHPQTKELKLFTGDVQQAINYLGRNTEPQKCVALIEDPNLNGAVYGAWADFQKKGGNQSAFNLVMKQGQSVGEVKAIAKLLIMVMKRAGYAIATIAPSERQSAKSPKNKGKDVRLLKMPTKLTREQFAIYTGHDVNESEHAFDAATLVWGKSVKQVELLILKKAVR